MTPGHQGRLDIAELGTCWLQLRHERDVLALVPGEIRLASNGRFVICSCDRAPSHQIRDSRGRDPVPLRLEPIDGATHQTFGGIVPAEVPEGAEVVASDASGQEIERRPLTWTIYEAT